MRTDSLFYRLFQTDPALVAALAGLDLPEARRYRFGSHEIKQAAFRFDGVLLPPEDRPDLPVLFVEVQFQPDGGFYLRLFSEILLYLRQYPSHRHWHAVVLYPSAAIERQSTASAPLLNLPNLHRVYLDQLPLRGSANPKHWIIALILAETEQIQPLVRQVLDHHQTHRDDGLDWLELLETVLVYKLPQWTREEIQAMFGLKDVDLKQTRFYQQAMDEGRSQGLAIGRNEGLIAGRSEGEAALLLRQLARRFGPVPVEVRQRIAAADAETLLIWGERLLDAKTMDEIWGA